MKITYKRYESISRVLTVMTVRLQSLIQYSIELRAAGFEGVYHPCVMRWFDDDLKVVNELHVQLKNLLSDNKLINDLSKELNNEE